MYVSKFGRCMVVFGYCNCNSRRQCNDVPVTRTRTDRRCKAGWQPPSCTTGETYCCKLPLSRDSMTSISVYSSTPVHNEGFINYLLQYTLTYCTIIVYDLSDAHRHKTATRPLSLTWECSIH